MTIAEPVTIRLSDLDSVGDMLPAAPGVYRTIPNSGEPHIGTSTSLRRRAERLLKTFGGALLAVECWPSLSKLDTSLLLLGITRRDFPGSYRTRLRLRTPAFVSFSYLNDFPRFTVASKIGSGVTIGPFPSRDQAQAFEERAAGLFQLRRCPGELIPDASHPGCIYGEMGHCLRPCQFAVSEDEYSTEFRRAEEFLASPPKRTLDAIAIARRKASEDMEFEHAALLHKRFERVKTTLSLLDDAITDVRTLSGAAVTPAFAPRSCYIRPMWNSHWQQPVIISFPERNSPETVSIDAQLRANLGPLVENASAESDPIDDLAVFQRWYRSSWREGEWVPFHSAIDYSKLVRRISKIVNLHNI